MKTNLFLFVNKKMLHEGVQKENKEYNTAFCPCGQTCYTPVSQNISIRYGLHSCRV